jgi:hypothetical protein
MEGNPVQKEEKPMRLRRMIVMLAAVASLSLGLPQAAGYAASAAPAAHPATGVPAPARATAAITAQTGRVTPLITFSDCPNRSTTWTDLDLLQVGGLMDWCFGGKGIWTFYTPYNEITSFCSGNNFGNLSYRLPNGQLTGFSFKPGRLFAFVPGSHIYQLDITGWLGPYRCYS